MIIVHIVLICMLLIKMTRKILLILGLINWIRLKNGLVSIGKMLNCDLFCVLYIFYWQFFNGIVRALDNGRVYIDVYMYSMKMIL